MEIDCLENSLFPRSICQQSNKPTLGFLCLGLPSLPARVLQCITSSSDLAPKVTLLRRDLSMRNNIFQGLVHNGTGGIKTFSRV